MPYEGEFASYGPLRRIADSQRVAQLLGKLRHAPVDEAGKPSGPILEAADITPGQWLPDWVLAVDGSKAEVTIDNGFPGAEAAYVTVASVMIDLARLMELDATRPIPPKEFRHTQQAESIDSALPGCNVVLDSKPTAKASLRQVLYEVFGDIRMSADGESLLDTYHHLLSLRPEVQSRQDCPSDDCYREFRPAPGCTVCSCDRRDEWYSTDALRIHEGMNPIGTNGAMFAEIMQVWERVWMVHILRTLEQKEWLSSLGRIAVVLDGPLAVFGHPAWLSQAIVQELQRINGVLRESTGGTDLLMLGVQKGGMFVDHFDLFDRGRNGPRVEPQSVFLLTDDYIRRNIVFSESGKPHGLDTYFGRNFYYKTQSGARIVATLPFLRPGDRDLMRAEPEQFPRLTDALALLDKLGSSRHANAITPLIVAHSEAAIPLHLGQKVLERLARDLMKK